MGTSLVYRNLGIYRFIMNLLYGGGYVKRFDRIWSLVGDDVRSVCELCFADTIIAERCRARGVRWTGVDLNPEFCRNARELGFDVREGDLFSVDLPPADLYVMAGSLYHFHDRLSPLMDTIFERSRRFILSEPVRNLSRRKGLIGWLARRAANPGSGRAPFRYDEPGLRAELAGLERTRGYACRIVSVDRDLVAEIRAT